MTLRRIALRIVAPAVAVALVAAALAPGASAASPSIYVASSDEYNASFKAEEGRLYVLELEGTTHCYYTEPLEDVGGGGFNAFAAPTLMQGGPEGLTAEGSGGGALDGTAQVKAGISGDAVTGTFSFGESEESFHCGTGKSGAIIGSEVSFSAVRYEPVGNPETAAPATGELPVFYGNSGPVEVFLRTTGNAVVGLRGAFAPRCPVGRKVGSGPRSLFNEPLGAKWSQDSHFRQRVEYAGKPRSGPAYKEFATISGQFEAGSVTGTYTRVRTSKPPHGPTRKCTTGPLPFTAVRYLPVAGG